MHSSHSAPFTYFVHLVDMYTILQSSNSDTRCWGKVVLINFKNKIECAAYVEASEV